MTAILWALIPLGAAFTLAVIAIRRDHRRPRYTVTELADTDRHDIDTWGAGDLHPARRVVHHWPALGDSDRLACCGEDPFAPGQSITIDPSKVTCAGGEG